ncbi:MAG: ABC transporter permease [Nitrospinae bacterium]|nr:ABC transporter permease [Nitrospinota bacterium]
MLDKFLEITAHWELIKSLVAKDLKVRYHGTIFGYFWSLINPFLMMLIYTLVFSVFLRIKMEHYALFLISALLPWTFFSNSMLTGTTAIVGNRHFLQKFYCPRELFPFAVILSNMTILVLSFLPFLAFLLYWKGAIGWSIIALPGVVFLHMIFTLGLVLILSSLYVFYRDIRHLLEFLMMIWFYMTPVIYPLSMVPEKFKFLFYFNPIVPIISLYRDILYSLVFPSLDQLLLTAAWSFATLLIGWKVFLTLEKPFIKEL